ncbi:MAG: hypothetical protein M3297_00260 [Thermoproteota archaeon]|nr:hypothetical protein [Thermoproteota archaeon]
MKSKRVSIVSCDTKRLFPQFAKDYTLAFKVIEPGSKSLVIAHKQDPTGGVQAVNWKMDVHSVSLE